MAKKILIVVGVLVLLVVGAMAYMSYRGRTLSPSAEQRITTSSGLEIRISYSRPSVRGRLVFGPEEDGALQPFGKYWRLGANEATVVEFNRDVQINGTDVPAGVYGMYAFPGEESFEIGLNASWDRWGYAEPDYTEDLVRMTVPRETTEFTEQFTIQLGEDATGVKIICLWDNTRFEIPVQELK